MTDTRYYNGDGNTGQTLKEMYEEFYKELKKLHTTYCRCSSQGCITQYGIKDREFQVIGTIRCTTFDLLRKYENQTTRKPDLSDLDNSR